MQRALEEREELLQKVSARVAYSTPRRRRAGRVDDKATPASFRSLPNKGQLFLLALCRLSEPLSNTCLLPYLYHLLESIQSPPPPSATEDGNSHNDGDAVSAAHISRLSGLLIAAFPLAQFATSMLHGHLSDAHGRKPTVLLGLLVSCVANLFFGFSRSIGALVFWRVLAGLANGNVGVMRTMTAEIARERKFQTRAFLLLPLVFNTGMVAALALGGCLAEPVVHMEWLFGPEGILNLAGNPEGVGWMVEYPYALPGVVNAAVLGGTLALAVLGLRETAPGKEGEDWGIKVRRIMGRAWRRLISSDQPVGYTEVQSDEPSDTPQEKDGFEDDDVLSKHTKAPAPRHRISFRRIWTREVVAAITSFGLLRLHNSAFMHTFAVFFSLPIAANKHPTAISFTGGLGLPSASVGLWLSLVGLAGIPLQLLAYPRIQARLGTLGVFRVALCLFPPVYAAAPYLALVRPAAGVARWMAIAAVLFVQVVARKFAIPSTVVLLTDAAPARSVLGTVHGAGNMVSSLARAIGPAVGGLVLSWGMERGVVGVVWWAYLTVMAVVALGWSYAMKGREEEWEGKERETGLDEDRV
ncbi:major facilitator superfamily domain-containing protein [Lineolata rhizophorae]|uniref:Major facilitator superfamily domain-containing protein n=1 Tax=Lineolata rhizophorae TaxID=578093 RepID=A0A6A6NN77_9PEZI|nr:major facilitator superfamily domain-containing protein [Lineolata rhizophorae]